MKLQNGFFKTFDGTKLFYSVQGEGPPLLFCYGLVCSQLHWSYQMEYFRNRYSVIWFDYRGHHLSDVPKNIESLTISNFAKDVDCLLHELKIPKITILGHSMGVNVALEYYRQNPLKVEALVLANGTPRGPLETCLRTNVLQYVFPHLFEAYKRYPKLSNLLWSAQGRTKIVSWMVGQLGFNPYLSKTSDIEMYVKMVTKMDMIITLQMLKTYEEHNATPWLHEIQVPTLIIAGEKDLITPKESQEIMHQLIPGSRFELIRNGSHCPQMDIPELLNIIIERFLLDIKTAPTPIQRRSPISLGQRSRQGVFS